VAPTQPMDVAAPVWSDRTAHGEERRSSRSNEEMLSAPGGRRVRRAQDRSQVAATEHGLPWCDDDRSPGPISSCPPRPVPHPLILQGWHDLTALRGRYPAVEVERLLPAGFGVDTVDGSAWVGLIPFRMRPVRLSGLPSL
jgi:hypothetical protein